MLFLLFLLSSNLFANTPEIISLGAGLSETKRVEGVTRVSVADGRVVKVRTIPPSTLLLIGLRTGKTLVRTWVPQGEGPSFYIEVVASQAPSPSRSAERGRSVVQVSLEFFEMGKSWSRSFGARPPDSIQAGTSASVTGDGYGAGLNYSVAFHSTKTLLQALVREGEAKVLANPRLSVRLGEEARFHSGGEFPVPTTLDSYGRLQRTISWKRYGTSIKVTPRSDDHFHIHSDIDVEISEPGTAQNSDNIPNMSRRQVTTKMNSRDGETVILSGLTRELTGKSLEGTPFLAHIPIVGPTLFSVRGGNEERNDILMAITLSFVTVRSDEDSYRDFRRKWEESEPN